MNFSHLTTPWLREAVKWWLKTYLPALELERRDLYEMLELDKRTDRPPQRFCLLPPHRVCPKETLVSRAPVS